jgi:hypothetical protein
METACSRYGDSAGLATPDEPGSRWIGHTEHCLTCDDVVQNV